jgi:hypothetical protein
VQAYFLAMELGLPALLVAIALAGAGLHRGGNARLLDWKPTRSPQREVELELGELDQMLSAQNRYRRARGLPARSLDDVSRQAWANYNLYGEMLSPPDDRRNDQ